ncbi:outer membrane assembly protein AsmA [Pantoea stewartii]|uniref:AsmA family protein n=1 Tax=Pantoea stewartii subsp. stewartii DC283 TaxID=660596 RepID=H3REK8_PANSE|nr:outer membrane assembly protein AsmA [Pantoea stewartii]ARF50707.1 outer membrane assembly protein AsmA [Pantoea stewartii subsp. stewartii DC283]EHU00184.1 AsmA family protein [Pantoea stewartii subsp. stewartii DC283]KAB0554704.1 outer membrane assembly protein AsmA [Pantoea stewartii subsp. stewartii]
MRRVITTLAILLVVVVAGLTALVMLVNPNDFRSYMVQQVQQRSGYQLTIDGDLRWHVWPKLSILAGRMSLTAPGAAQPVVSADNMRLDVNLLPLLSHQLSVSQVMLKNAIVRVTPDSAARAPENAPRAPHNSEPTSSAGWSFDIDNLQLSDSLLIWQQPGGDAFTFRNLNLDMEQDQSRIATIGLTTSLTRNQRTAVLTLKGQLDKSRYPHQLSGQEAQVDYNLTGASLPPEGIKGTLSFQGNWDLDKNRFDVSNLKLTANDSVLSGRAEGELTPPQKLALDLHASALNMDNLLFISTLTQQMSGQNSQIAPAPVIADQPEPTNADSPLNDIDLDLSLQADSAVWRGLNLTKLSLKAVNQQGLVTFSTLSGNVGQGSFSVPGSIDIRQPVTQVAFTPVLNQIAIQPLLKALALPPSLQGTLSLKGELSGENLTLADAKRSWQGKADIQAHDLKLAQLDLQQMVRSAVARVSDRVSSDSQASGQGIEQVSGQLAMKNGLLTLSHLDGGGKALTLRGEGRINLVQQQLDVTLGLTLSDWRGDEKLVAALSDQVIPFRIYGSWANPQYTLPVDDVMRDRLQNEAKSRLNQWLDRQQAKDKNSTHP